MNTRQLLSVGIDIGTTTTQVILDLELVNRAVVSQVPRYEFINVTLACKARCSLPLLINRWFKK
ncbi:ethanolamine ammonia-lyase reactivating factor EutA [Escherichia coli]